MLARNSRMELARPQAGVANKESRQLKVALGLLLVALAVVIGTNREFWFGSDEAIESNAAAPVPTPKATSPATTVKTGQAVLARAAAPKNRPTPRTSTEPTVTAPSNNAPNPSSPVVATTRTILPPLEVEVVAGDTHRRVHPGSNVTKVEIPNDSNRIATVTTSEAAVPANAAQRENISSGSISELRQTVDATYPLLGQHAMVQGAVVLQAVVGTDGVISDLRVLSGPAILTAAAQQAVRQWRFKPYLQNGQAVETKARITVNFSIQISNNPAKTS